MQKDNKMYFMLGRFMGEMSMLEEQYDNEYDLDATPEEKAQLKEWRINVHSSLALTLYGNLLELNLY